MGDVRDEVDVKELFLGGLRRYGELVHQIRDDQWTDGTPCTDWDVRDLVHHLVGECVWVPPLLEGKTIAEVGHRFAGDLLGEDPVGAWDRSEEGAERAVPKVDLDATVHVSYGDIRARHYLFEVANDLWVHGWDLARAISADETMDAAAVEALLAYYGPREEELKATGAFGPRVQAAPGADPQVRLLAVFGRVA